MLGDPVLARLPHRIEIDRDGHILMSPPRALARDDRGKSAALISAVFAILALLVHIASHFKFDADGNSNDSFLLLGNGKLTKLTIAQIAAIPNFFAGVELLTLSACQTGVGDEASRQEDNQGVEVESLGVLAQRKGASAVIASLWEVADVSTSKLMLDFYKCHDFSHEKLSAAPSCPGDC